MENQSTLYDLTGGIPISEQLAAATQHLAHKSHSHDEYALRSEIEELNRKLNMLLDLVGDMPVSEQVEMAIKNIK